MFNSTDRALELALNSVHVVSIDGATSTDPRDYVPVLNGGSIAMVERIPTPIGIDLALTLNGRSINLHYVRDEQRTTHLVGLESSGIAALWLTALDLFGLRFAITRARDAARDLQTWLSEEGKTSEAAVFIGTISDHLERFAAGKADDYEQRHNPFNPLAIAA
ncbi:hypothetical protein [Burkholderia vietnamiensis]|uniref:hypothetical protein n=1 Tax=Burkholderia vietnamiensis TaxID=60552 RepID=UPI001CF4961B|nr:hypothetical protein [Burkholderia vietnamiensis]MCA8448954.1 hypothetical protein [Burkholderia vietnamiensis]